MNYYIGVFKKWNDFKGRSRRAEYWQFILFNFIVYVILYIALALLVVATKTQIFRFVIYLYAFLVIIPGLAVAVRRLHDTGRSGWWILISLIPIIGVIWLLVFFVLDSNPGDNKYGPNPKISAPPIQPVVAQV